jgi:penicillin-binding protein 1B
MAPRRPKDNPPSDEAPRPTDRARRQTASPKGPAKKPGAKKPGAKKPGAKKPPAKRTVVRKKGASPRRRGIGRWLLIETSVVLAGLVIGLAVASLVLWQRAERDVQAWLDQPPVGHLTWVMSAPMQLEVGQPLDLRDLAQDLLSAGFEASEGDPVERQFSVRGDEIRVRVPRHDAANLTSGPVKIVVRDGRIAATQPTDVALPPTVLARLGDLDRARDPVALSAMGPYTGNAVMAMEDARFRQHIGIDPIGLARAAWHNVRRTDSLHGGSTLTQQLAKNLFLTQDRTARRKVREIFGAVALERRFSKDELLALYLNEVYLGQSGGVPIVGVEQAARAWFGRSAANLTLGQAAVIAGVISAPNAYSPTRHPERAWRRAELTLDRMQTLGWVPADAVARARTDGLLLSGVVIGGARLAPWAVDAAMEQAERALPEGDLKRGHLRIHTTIQPHLQRAAERAVADGLTDLAQAHPKATDAQAALVAVRATDGAIVAIVGGRNYEESPYDRASQARREIGSTVKPLTLVAALDADRSLHPASKVVDEPIIRKIDGKPWTPKNADGQHLGPITLRAAVEQSRNIPAIKMAEHVGPQALQRFLRRAGLDGATNLPSAALGAFPATPLQIAGAYTVFPNGGTVVAPTLVTQLQDAEGRTLLSFPAPRDAIASARACAMSTSVLQGTVTHGTARRAANYGISGEVGAKTGTTNEGRDAWFAGVTPRYSIVAWVGRDRGAPLGLGGAQAALPIWARFVANGGVAGGAFTLPDGLSREPVCRDSGLLAREACPHPVDEILSGSNKIAKCDVHGGPVVEPVRWFRNLFRKAEEASVVGGPEDLSTLPPAGEDPDEE